MTCWRSLPPIVLALGLVAAVGWAQTSPESSRPVRGTGEAGRPDAGVLTIQGILQGRPVTVDFHHTAASSLHVLAMVPHITSVTHVAGTVRVSDIAGNVVGVTAAALNIGGNIGHLSAVVHVSAGTSPLVTGYRVNCGTTAATAVNVVTTRRDLDLQNVGTVNIYVMGGHVTVTTSNAWTLHAASVSPATSRLRFENFQGRLDCIADGPGQTLELIQTLK